MFGTENIAILLVALLLKWKDPSTFIQGFLDTLPSSTAKNEVSFWSFLNEEFITSVLDPLYEAQELATCHGMSGVQAKEWDMTSVVTY